jgi:8-amino-7-oxononanoate synthase
MDSKLEDKLTKRNEEGTMRSLSFSNASCDFYSNDYLGFSKINSIEIASSENGGTGSRLISGNSPEAVHCEKSLARFFKAEEALVLNSGYVANLAVFSALPQRGDTIIYDENIHASVRDGIRLSLANSFAFKHNSTEDLLHKIKHASGSVYIAVESLYSMDGDFAPLAEIVAISNEKNAFLIVDEAHACGVFGENGRGIVDLLGLNEAVFAKVVTFGKAYGAHGACILGEKKMIDFLVNFARPFIYTTAMPPKEYARIEQMVLWDGLQEQQQILQQNCAFFRAELKSNNLISAVNSPIQMLRIGDISALKRISAQLANEDIAVKPIFSPTVKKGDESLRICIHSYNSFTEIQELCTMLSSIL